MDGEQVLPSLLVAHLTDRLQEGLAFDVAYGAADLDDDDIAAAGPGHVTDAVLDLAGDVGDRLDGTTQEIAPPLFLDDGLVYLTGGHGTEAGEVLIDEALVVSQVEVSLRTVAGDEYFAVLVRRHGAGVNVEVGVEFLDGDRDVAALEDAADSRRCYPFADGADYPACDEYVLRHRPLSMD